MTNGLIFTGIIGLVGLIVSIVQYKQKSILYGTMCLISTFVMTAIVAYISGLWNL